MTNNSTIKKLEFTLNFLNEKHLYESTRHICVSKNESGLEYVSTDSMCLAVIEDKEVNDITNLLKSLMIDNSQILLSKDDIKFIKTNINNIKVDNGVGDFISSSVNSRRNMKFPNYKAITMFNASEECFFKNSSSLKVKSKLLNTTINAFSKLDIYTGVGVIFEMQEVEGFKNPFRIKSVDKDIIANVIIMPIVD